MDLCDGVSPIESEDVDRVVDVFEAAVRATHDFVSEADIARFLPLVREAVLGRLATDCVRDRDGRVVGFVGVADGNIAMLFIDPACHGLGIGRRLVRHALDVRGAATVDVYEQNEPAVRFYLSLGFTVVGRSEQNSLGMPYPLLHMQKVGDTPQE